MRTEVLVPVLLVVRVLPTVRMMVAARKSTLQILSNLFASQLLSECTTGTEAVPHAMDPSPLGMSR